MKFSPHEMPTCRLLFFHALFPALLTSSSAQEKKADSSRITLDRIFQDNEFSARRASLSWQENGPGYTKREERGIVRYVPGKKKGKLLVPIGDLIPKGQTEPLSVEGLTWSDDKSLLLIYTSSKRVWRTNIRGDYWILDRGAGVLRQLGGDGPPSTMSFAQISPDNRHVAFVRNGNIFVENLHDQSVRAITEKKTEFIINGTFDWVYEEELRLRNGFRWSPDGKSIAYWQLDAEGVREFTMIDNVSGLYPRLQTFAYPKTGQRNSAARIGVVSIETGKTRWLKIPGDPREHYLARMDWVKNDSNRVIFQQLNRLQNTNQVMLGDAKSGEAETIFTETDEAWVDVDNELFWIENGKRFTWMSERDGWRHIYLASPAEGDPVQVTKGEFDVIQLLKVDHRRRLFYFSASPENPAERYLYRVKFDGSGLQRVTPESRTRGTHAYSFSGDARFAVWTASNFDTPPVSTLIRLPDHKPIRVLEENEKLNETLSQLDRPKSEFFYIDIGGGTKLHARCLKPPGFDPEKSYPLLLYVYGEPAGQTVRDSWGGSTQMWHWMLAQRGVVQMTIDNRGTSGPRGRDFRKQVYRKIGTLGPEDQAKALRALLKERPYLDKKRVGIWGWSGGGSSSLHAIFKYPRLYQAAISIAAVPNQRYYDTIYQERYMGLPDDNVEGYRDGSAIHFADQLEGDLLIIHGTADDNCHYATFEKLIDELIRHNKQFSMMAYPNRAHGI
ncbi:MAG: S9 family peptidase, partial [Verrucomicrobiales bacterium]|nr:S9 family peptidase [Verrucomicrobiales bacterium]